jgi:hypothetical protein
VPKLARQTSLLYFGAELARRDPTTALGGGVSTVLKIARLTLLTSRRGFIHNAPSHLTLRWTDQDISQPLPLAAD